LIAHDQIRATEFELDQEIRKAVAMYEAKVGRYKSEVDRVREDDA